MFEIEGGICNLLIYCKLLQTRHDSVLITKAGKPVAALVDIEIFEKIRAMREQFDHLTAELARAYKGVDKKIAETEILKAIKKTRSDK